MHVDHLRRARALVEVVHILRDDLNLELFFQFCQRFMSCIRFRPEELFPSLVVKFQYQRRV